MLKTLRWTLSSGSGLYAGNKIALRPFKVLPPIPISEEIGANQQSLVPPRASGLFLCLVWSRLIVGRRNHWIEPAKARERENNAANALWENA